MIGDAELRAAMRRRIDCPLPWCSGTWLDHGGDGQPPSDWIHASEDPAPIGGGAGVIRQQDGGGAEAWSLIVGPSIAAEADSRDALAAQLRSWAASVDRLPV